VLNVLEYKIVYFLSFLIFYGKSIYYLRAILSIIITLRSIEKSNELFLFLKIRERFSKILFTLN